MTGRAVSSVLDVAVCLLLVSASALALTQVPQEPDSDRPGRADATLERLTTTTAWIEYTPERGATDRTAHGTLAGLLAASAAANATTRGRATVSADGFRRAVATEVRRATTYQDVRAQVIARWRPSPEAHVGGRTTVGPSPPPSADVHAASTVVPLGSEDTEATAFGQVRLTIRTWSR